MRKLVGLLVGLTLAVSVVGCKPREITRNKPVETNDSERCVIPQKFINPDIYNFTFENIVVKGVKYYTHLYDIDGDKLADKGVFFELDNYGKPLDHPERPKFYVFDFDESNSFTLDELCEKRVRNGKIEWYKFKPEDLPKPKKKFN